jgi:hypothetical protein
MHEPPELYDVRDEDVDDTRKRSMDKRAKMASAGCPWIRE